MTDQPDPETPDDGQDAHEAQAQARPDAQAQGRHEGVLTMAYGTDDTASRLPLLPGEAPPKRHPKANAPKVKPRPKKAGKKK